MRGRPKGYPKSGGRKPGTLNKATADIQAAAREYTAQAIETLAKIMLKGEAEQARIMACKELLDRGWGKARQPLTGEGEGGAIVIQVATGVLRATAAD